MLTRPSRLLGPLAAILAIVLVGCGSSSTSKPAAKPKAAPLAPVSTHGAGGLATRNTTRLGGEDAVTDAAAIALATHPGLTPTTRPAAVVLVDAHNWPVALAAAVLAGAPLHAPLLYTDGEKLPDATRQALRTMRPTGSWPAGAPSAAGASTATSTKTAPSKSTRGAQVIAIAGKPPAGYRTRTLAGVDPPQLAVAIERLQRTLGGKAPTQVIVVAEDAAPALAMPAAGLAAETGAPILLVSSAGIPPATSAALSSLHRPAIYVVGPPTAVGKAVMAKLRAFGTVKRVAGSNPVENAIAVARFADGDFGWGVTEPGHGLVFANASRPLDAPAAASLSAGGDYGPLLLLEGPDRIPVALGRYLSNIQPGYTDVPSERAIHGVYNHGWLLGDELAISTRTQAELDALLEISLRPTTTTTE